MSNGSPQVDAMHVAEPVQRLDPRICPRGSKPRRLNHVVGILLLILLVVVVVGIPDLLDFVRSQLDLHHIGLGRDFRHESIAKLQLQSRQLGQVRAIGLDIGQLVEGADARGGAGDHIRAGVEDRNASVGVATRAQRELAPRRRWRQGALQPMFQGRVQLISLRSGWTFIDLGRARLAAADLLKLLKDGSTRLRSGMQVAPAMSKHLGRHLVHSLVHPGSGHNHVAETDRPVDLAKHLHGKAVRRPVVPDEHPLVLLRISAVAERIHKVLVPQLSKDRCAEALVLHVLQAKNR
mmetsp:Transcript_123438/g.356890  ORF Transcript_123438/g.356890 Transcript_123438/m.356890 type:complete len:293 (+) Transcript_123438:546-1424(+)